uniref:FACT-Spt16_Nlob domain-containing protein n=1 Tax=Heterorhabditis bacteriophora TaxID=37862 RepID=A0A1I7WCC8_HETBA
MEEPNKSSQAKSVAITPVTLQKPDVGGWMQWGKSSLMKLAEAEGRLFASFGAHVISRFIPHSEMYTVTAEASERKVEEPVVLMHGFGAGVAVWCANIHTLAKNYTIHAFDLLGFGRSSRPRFSNDPTLAELEMVESIEDWRKAMGIEKMYLVAHSFGAYLASSYALEHPNRVKHLILVDPWGFPEKIVSTEKQGSFSGLYYLFLSICVSRNAIYTHIINLERFIQVFPGFFSLIIYDSDLCLVISIFQTWLFNTELLDTLVLLTKKGIYVLGSNRKADYFNSVKSESANGVVPPVTPIHRDKDAANFGMLLGYIKNDAGNKFGYFSKDSYDSEFCSAWNKAVESSGAERVDLSPVFVHLFAVKDNKEVETCRSAASASVNAWIYLRKKYIEAIDQEKKIKHSRLAGDIDTDIGNVKVQGALSKTKAIETCYSPIIMSGGQYSFKWSNERYFLMSYIRWLQKF